MPRGWDWLPLVALATTCVLEVTSDLSERRWIPAFYHATMAVCLVICAWKYRWNRPTDN